jgi:hypothetical protein
LRGRAIVPTVWVITDLLQRPAGGAV